MQISAHLKTVASVGPLGHHLASMGYDQPLRIPELLRHDVEQIFSLTDPFCVEHLDAEYGELVRKLIGKLARKRPSPLARGDLRIWAAAAIYAVGSVNFLFDRSQRPHLTGDQLSELTGVPKSTLANKAKVIRDVLRIRQLEPGFCRRALVESNPLCRSGMTSSLGRWRGDEEFTARRRGDEPRREIVIPTSSTAARTRGDAPGSRAGGRPAPTVEAFRADPLFPRIERAVAAILESGKVVAPVDVLVGMGLLRREHLEDWRRGRVPYLERVVNCNLTRLSRVLRILRFHAHDLKLVPSLTAYARWGKGPKRRLRFTRHADPKLEDAYSRHFVWPGKRPFRRGTDGGLESRTAATAAQANRAFGVDAIRKEAKK